MELKSNNVVKLRNGKHGVTASFNGKPFQMIFDSFTCPISRFNEKLENKNHNYDIVEVYDGSCIENVKDVFKKKFSTENLHLIWKKDE